MIFFTALRKELLEQWRSYRLLIVGAVLIVFGIASPLIAKLTPELIKLVPEGESLATLIPAPTAADAVAQYAKNMNQFGIVLALLVTMGAVAHEKDKGTAAVMLVKPMPRSVFLMAKFAALSLTFGVSIALATVGSYAYTRVLFGALDAPAWLALNILFLIYVLVFVALTLLCSTLMRSTVAAGGLAFGVLIVFSILSALPAIAEVLPGQLIAWGAGLALGADIAAWPALGVSLALIAVSLVVAWLVFERQEL